MPKPIALSTCFVTEIDGESYWELTITYDNDEKHVRKHNYAFDIYFPIFQQHFASCGVKTIYNITRVSTKEQADVERTSPDSQSNALQAMPDSKNTHNVRVLNIGIAGSAFHKFHTDMMEIINGCVRGDEIRVWRVDRFSRNLEIALPYLQFLKNKGVDVVSVFENVSFVKNEEKFIELLKIATAESQNLSTRIRQSRKHLLAQGHSYIGGHCAYGEKIATVDGKRKRVQNDEEIAVIRRIVRMRNNEEYSVGKIAEILNFQHVYHRNKPWTVSMVSRIVKKNLL